MENDRTWCAYCGYELADGDVPVPPPENAEAWVWAGVDHAENCEWVKTRAFQIVEV